MSSQSLKDPDERNKHRDVGTFRPVDVIGQRTHNSVLEPNELLLFLLPLLKVDVN